MQLLVIYGPTAVGKTQLLTTLASELSARGDAPGGLEVISADSMQVYRGLDIGTAKPDAELRSHIPHHLIDVCDPQDQYDVGAFVRDALLLIPEIHARSALPVVSGGTAYYLKHLLLGLPEAPQSSPEIREAVQKRARELTPHELHAELVLVDPASAARINENDTYRVSRALEVYAQTGRPLSSFNTTRPPDLPLHPILVSLDRDPDELRDRIRDRVATMFAAGLRAEIESLVAAGCASADPAMKAIGYREFFSPDGTVRPESDDSAIQNEMVFSTARYAKRQRTFLRQLATRFDFLSVDPEDTSTPSKILDALFSNGT